MKFNSIRLILIFSSVVFLSSCLGTTDVTSYSTNPSFSSLTFAANDSIPYLSTAAFTLEYDSQVGDSVIVNLDSLPFNTRIDSVYPTFTFKSSTFAYIIYTNTSDTVHITGTDTIDFSMPMKVRNYAADTTFHRDYVVKVNVHKVEPKLYVWQKINSGIYSHSGGFQKTVLFNDTLFLYVNSGVKNYLYTSVDGYTWNSEIVTGLPAYNPLRSVVEYSGSLYLTDDDGTNLYYTSDGFTWNKSATATSEYIFKSLLYDFNGKLWAVTQSKTDQQYYFRSYDGTTWSNPMSSDVIPQNFPVQDFTALSFSTRNGKPKVLVLGGYLPDNTYSKHSWSSENNTNWFDFSNENHSLDTLAAGASIIAYDNKLLLFGMRNDLERSVAPLKESTDEGLSWQTPDSVYNYLPDTYNQRSYQSVIVYKPRIYSKSDTKQQIEESNRIFIIGGKNGQNIFSDVWTGKLNRKNFLRQ